ncbi:phage tail assembly protein [Avibacterium sp. 20-126]|uniref:phage tail assembly protein n=1 Tax=Avibacterium sp. 20-126 TaxID=2911524 RepID=UPI0021883DC0|nr:phage tail assembly protein [Avibacterium sp. 20-126]
MSEIIISLDYPITDGEGKTITELHLRRAKAKDLRAAQSQKNEADQEFFLVARLTGLVMEDVGELDVADYQKVQLALKEMQKGKSK